MTIALRKAATADEADLRILSLASNKRKFAIEVGLPMEPAMIDAFERGIDHEWFALVDISTGIPSAMERLMRVYRLTDAGMTRLAVLSRMEGVGHG
jgi:hypothetical protein